MYECEVDIGATQSRICTNNRSKKDVSIHDIYGKDVEDQYPSQVHICDQRMRSDDGPGVPNHSAWHEQGGT